MVREVPQATRKKISYNSGLRVSVTYLIYPPHSPPCNKEGPAGGILVLAFQYGKSKNNIYHLVESLIKLTSVITGGIWNFNYPGPPLS